MFNATEAREYSNTPKEITFIEHLYEIWMCGIINKRITKAVKNKRDNFYMIVNAIDVWHVWENIARHYRDLGYEVFTESLNGGRLYFSVHW